MGRAKSTLRDATLGLLGGAALATILAALAAFRRQAPLVSDRTIRRLADTSFLGCPDTDGALSVTTSLITSGADAFVFASLDSAGPVEPLVSALASELRATERRVTVVRLDGAAAGASTVEAWLQRPTDEDEDEIDLDAAQSPEVLLSTRVGARLDRLREGSDVVLIASPSGTIADALARTHRIRRILVVSPLATREQSLRQSFTDHDDDSRPLVISVSRPHALA